MQIYLDMDSSHRQVKEKKTRRRLRLSCVECTKRRQRCDRKYPCSLCVSRGVSHLCRWETVPLARPTPARPPIASSIPDQNQTIRELRARIADLEKTLGNQSLQYEPIRMKLEPMSEPLLYESSPSGSSPLVSSTATTSPYTTPGPDVLPQSPLSEQYVDGEKEPLLPIRSLAPAAYATTSTLAQLSLGHHGEYIGRGSLICTLHALGTKNTSRFLYAKSTDSTCSYREPSHGLSSNSLIRRVEDLIQSIPPKRITMTLMQAFFAECNWYFGIPEEWFQNACSQMWNVLEYPGPHGVQINANWLSLLFAILAYAPNRVSDGQMNGDSSEHYFVCSTTARRVAEDDFLSEPNVSLMASAADGTVLNCLAVPILSCYLSQRGRVSEAWKLVGNGLRTAEAVGMHRDPEWDQWHVMSKDEILLRRRAWWGLVIWDKLYSYMVGRPQMLHQGVFDVVPPRATQADGTRDRFNLGQCLFIGLANLVGEVSDKCLNVAYPSCSTFFEIDAKLEQWEERLPPEYQQQRDDSSTRGFDQTELMTIECQRYALLSWYLLSRTKLNIASMTGLGRTPQSRQDILRSRRVCVTFCMRLIRFQWETYESACQYKVEHSGQGPVSPGNNWYFEGCFSLFEAAVALLTTLARFPLKEKVVEANRLVEGAIDVLTEVAREEVGKKGEIARMGSEVLRVLQQESWWRAQISPVDVATVQTLDLPDSYDPTKPYSPEYDWFASMTYSNFFGTMLHRTPTA